MTTERTTICTVTHADGEFFYRLMNSPGWLHYIGDRSISNTESAVNHIRDGYIQSYKDNGFGYYVIRDLTSNCAMGICGFLQRPELDHPDFGFAMLPEFERQGLAKEASSALFSYGIQQFGFSVVDAITKTDNAGSIRLLESLGFSLIHTNHENSGETGLALYRWSRRQA